MPGEPAIGDEDRVRRQGLVQLAAEARHMHRPVARIEPRRGIVFPGLHARGDFGDIVGPRRAGGGGAIRQRLGKVFEPGPRIAPQRDLGGDAAADLFGDDVEMNHRDVGRRQREALGRDLAELAADDDQAIRRLDQVVGDARIAAEQADRQRVRAGDAALAAHRVRDRDRLRFGEAGQRAPGFGQVNPAAGQQQRPFCLGDQLRGALDIGAIGADAPGRRLQRRFVDDEILGREIVGAVADILGHVEQHRPWPPRGRHRERAPHQLGDAARHLDADQLLDRGLEDFDLAAFLGHVLPGMRAVGVAGDRDDRDAAIQRLDEPGDEVGGAGAERAVANAGAVGDPCIGVGGEGAAALVVDQVVVQADQADRVVERQQLEPAHAEHRPGARQAQHLGERAPAGHRARRAILQGQRHGSSL